MASASAGSSARPAVLTRSRKSAAAGLAPPSIGRSSESGPTGPTFSPRTPRGVRDVTSNEAPEGSRSMSRRRVRSLAATCSALSKSTSAPARIANVRHSGAAASSPPGISTPRSLAMRRYRESSSVQLVRSTSSIPPTNACAIRHATVRAVRVFPIPPSPVSVTRRCPAPRSACAAAASGRSTKLSSCGGSVCLGVFFVSAPRSPIHRNPPPGTVTIHRGRCGSGSIAARSRFTVV
jgi:hypothetical protein